MDNKKIKSFLKKYWKWILGVFVTLSPILIPELRQQIIMANNSTSVPHEKDFLTVYITFLGVIGIIGTLFFNFQRLKRQDNQLEKQQTQIQIQQNQIGLQREANIDQRFALAVETLGSKGESARTGAIYSLYHLAMENEKYRQSVMDIICAHMRSTTKNKEYIKNYLFSPSNEIQICINIMFKENGIYFNFFSNLTQPDLSESILNGCNFSNTECINVNFKNSTINKASFFSSNLSYSEFNESEIIKTDFNKSTLINAQFISSNLSGSIFSFSCAALANFTKAFLITSHLNNCSCLGANFYETNLSASYLYKSEFYDSLFVNTILSGSFTDRSHTIHSIESRINKKTVIDNSIFFKILYRDKVQNIAEKYYRSDSKYYSYYNKYSFNPDYNIFSGLYSQQDSSSIPDKIKCEPESDIAKGVSDIEDIYSSYYYHSEPVDKKNQLPNGIILGMLSQDDLRKLQPYLIQNKNLLKE